MLVSDFKSAEKAFFKNSLMVWFWEKTKTKAPPSTRAWLPVIVPSNQLLRLFNYSILGFDFKPLLLAVKQGPNCPTLLTHLKTLERVKRVLSKWTNPDTLLVIVFPVSSREVISTNWLSLKTRGESVRLRLLMKTLDIDIAWFSIASINPIGEKNIKIKNFYKS